jgi:SpoVK/Ycf46/Vps4 family AAA+-type ATPase
VSPTCAFAKLVLGDELLDRLGTAVTSGTSIFLYGPSGTGKTTLASSLPSIYEDFVLIPHAIEIDGQVIAVFDPSVHQRAELPQEENRDDRWLLCYRPRVMMGGELSSEMLEVQFNGASRLLTAPLQLKANNGVFVLDDFGRQRIRPEELLNRWMTPLDRRMDFLMLPGGKKFEIPFDVLVVFATNLDPRTLTDEAFLRRIPNKINVNYVTSGQFAEIFERECLARGLACERELGHYVAALIAKEMHQLLCPSHVGDVINQILWAAAYRGIQPRLTRATLAQACRNYFLPVAKV